MGWNRKRLLLCLWIPVVLYVGLIFWIASSPRRIPGAERWPFIDKPLHSLEYAPLGSLLARAISQTWATWEVGIVLAAGLGFTFLVAASDEFYQRFVPGKESASADVAWDLIGAALGQRFWWAKLRNRRKA